MDTYIYGLKDPRDGELYYIGKSNHPAFRLRQHLEDNTNAGKIGWLRDLQSSNLKPELVILETVKCKQWQAAERRWIALGRDSGWPLVNIRNGGDGLTGKREPFEFFKPFLSGEPQSGFDKLSDEQKWGVCHWAALAMMRYSGVAIRAQGGKLEMDYSAGAQFSVAWQVAHDMVCLLAKDERHRYDDRIAGIQADAHETLAAVRALVDGYQ